LKGPVIFKEITLKQLLKEKKVTWRITSLKVEIKTNQQELYDQIQMKLIIITLAH
jgi:hypothetical protein